MRPAAVIPDERDDAWTRRSSRERALPTDEFLVQLFDALPTAVLVRDPDAGCVTWANRAFGGLVGLPAEEIAGSRPPYPWSASEERAADPGARANGGAQVEALFRHRDGQLVPVEIETVVIRDSAGAPVSEVGLITDLSERRRLEQQLRQSGKLAAIGELAAGVAHEINNPLFAILGLVEFLLKEVEPGSKAQDRLLLVQQTGLEIKDIVRALLDFAREPSGVFTTVALEEVASQTVELVRRTTGAKDVQVVERYEAGGAPVNGSPNQLKQVFLNLLTNAHQALPTGGTITLSVHREGDWAVATVEDDGPGIPENVLPHVFQPFYTRKRDQGGTGLGLSVSLGIAQAHGGDLSAHSTPGRGARFVLRLPVAAPEEPR
jgi:PAS domain S-box-containing protein